MATTDGAVPSFLSNPKIVSDYEDGLRKEMVRCKRKSVSSVEGTVSYFINVDSRERGLDSGGQVITVR